MNYKTYEKDKNIYFRYMPIKKRNIKVTNKIKLKDSPFEKLASINFK